MGHSTAEVFVQAMPGANLTPEQIKRQALEQWAADEADRYDDPRAGEPLMLPAADRETAERFGFGAALYSPRSGAGWLGNPSTLIVPIVDAVKQEKFSIEHHVPSKQLADWRKSPWSAHEAAEGKLRRPLTQDSVKVSKLPAVEIDVRRTEGDLTHVYVLAGVDQWGRPAFIGDADKVEHTTLAQSEKAAKMCMRNADARVASVQVRKVPKRGGTTAFSTITRVEPAEDTTVTITGTFPVPLAKARTLGWMVAFDYHH